IEVTLSPRSLAQIRLQALTNCGTVRTNAGQDQLEDTSFSTTTASDKSSRNWRGMKSTPKADRNPGAFFESISRLDAVLTGADRTDGLDLISRAGTVVVTVEK